MMSAHLWHELVNAHAAYKLMQTAAQQVAHGFLFQYWSKLLSHFSQHAADCVWVCLPARVQTDPVPKDVANVGTRERELLASLAQLMQAFP